MENISESLLSRSRWITLRRAVRHIASGALRLRVTGRCKLGLERVKVTSLRRCGGQVVPLRNCASDKRVLQWVIFAALMLQFECMPGPAGVSRYQFELVPTNTYMAVHD